MPNAIAAEDEMQEEQYECAKFKVSHQRVLCVFKESERFATQVGFERKFTKSGWDLHTYFYLVDNAPSEEKQILQLTAMFNKKETFTDKDENKVYFNNI